MREAVLVLAGPDGTDEVHALTVGQIVSIGSGAGNRIVLDDDRCSRTHCELRCHQGDWYVRDFGVVYRTLVNDARVDGHSRLVPGDVLTVGDTQLRFTSRDRLFDGVALEA